LFLQITNDVPEDLPIPGRRYTFGILEQAQALGDVRALRQEGRRVLVVRLSGDVSRGLQALLELMTQALSE